MHPKHPSQPMQAKSLTEILATGIPQNGGLAQLADAEQEAALRLTKNVGDPAKTAGSAPTSAYPVEQCLADLVGRMGGQIIKCMPEELTNRMVLLPNGRLGFLEMLPRGEVPSQAQQSRIQALEKLGMVAGWASSYDGVQRFLGRLGCRIAT